MKKHILADDGSTIELADQKVTFYLPQNRAVDQLDPRIEIVLRNEGDRRIYMIDCYRSGRICNYSVMIDPLIPSYERLRVVSNGVDVQEGETASREKVIALKPSKRIDPRFPEVKIVGAEGIAVGNHIVRFEDLTVKPYRNALRSRTASSTRTCMRNIQ